MSLPAIVGLPSNTAVVPQRDAERGDRLRRLWRSAGSDCCQPTPSRRTRRRARQVAACSTRSTPARLRPCSPSIRIAAPSPSGCSTRSHVGAVAGVRWYEINPVPAVPVVLRQGNISASPSHLFNGAISSDRKVRTGVASQFGDSFVIHYSVTRSGRRPASTRASWPGRASTAGGRRLRQSLQNSAPPTSTSAAPARTTTCRWGDYAGANPDPVSRRPAIAALSGAQTSGQRRRIDRHRELAHQDLASVLLDQGAGNRALPKSDSEARGQPAPLFFDALRTSCETGHKFRSGRMVTNSPLAGP